MTLSTISMIARSILLMALAVVVMMLTTGQSSEVAMSGRMRVAAVALILFVLVVTPVKWQPLQTLFFWVALGATVTLPVYMIFSSGVWSVVPLVCLVVYAAILGRDMATNVTILGVVLSMIVVVVFLNPMY